MGGQTLVYNSGHGFIVSRRDHAYVVVLYLDTEPPSSRLDLDLSVLPSQPQAGARRTSAVDSRPGGIYRAVTM